MQILDNLTDGRQLIRVQTPKAATLLPGQSILSGKMRLPVLRHDIRAQTLDLVCTNATDFDDANSVIVGAPLAITIADSLRMISYNDGIFAALHFLFQQPTALRSRVSVIAQFDHALPFRPCPSRLYSARLPGHVIAALPLLEDWGVFNRLVHAEAVGCFDGTVEQLRDYFPAVVQEIVLR